MLIQIKPCIEPIAPTPVHYSFVMLIWWKRQNEPSQLKRFSGNLSCLYVLVLCLYGLHKDWGLVFWFDVLLWCTSVESGLVEELALMHWWFVVLSISVICYDIYFGWMSLLCWVWCSALMHWWWVYFGGWVYYSGCDALLHYDTLMLCFLYWWMSLVSGFLCSAANAVLCFCLVFCTYASADASCL